MIKQEVPFEAAQLLPRGEAAVGREAKGSWFLGLTSFGFILLQSVCTALMALSGLRLVIGVGSLAAASSLKAFAGPFHVDAIRIPMMTLALAGAALNLFVIWRLRSLRGRGSSQWRMTPVPAAKKRAENIQIALAAATVILVGMEQVFHVYLNG